MADKRKQSVYFPAHILADIRAQAKRERCSVSAVVQRIWEMARERIAQLPSAPDWPDS